MYKIVNRKKRAVVALADLVGETLWRLLGRSPGHRVDTSPSPEVKKILAIRLAYVGDVVMTLPVLKPLRAHFPRAQVYFLTNTQATELFVGNPYVDHVIGYDAFWFYAKRPWEAWRDYLAVLRLIRREQFDLAIDFRADLRDIFFIAYMGKIPQRISYGAGGGGFLLSRVIPFEKVKHRVEFHLDILRGMGIETSEPEQAIYLSEAERQRAAERLAAQGVLADDLTIGIHPGARVELRRWPAERFARLADILSERYGAKLVITGGRDEIPLIQRVQSLMRRPAIVLAGQTKLRELAALLERLDLFICNDTGPLHIAAAVKTPVVAIFGPSKSLEARPFGTLHRVVEKEFPCRLSCDDHRCHNSTFHACMQAVEVTDVVQAVEELLQR